MLAQLAHPMTVPFSTRRAAQAAAVTLSLIGAGAGAAAEVKESYISVSLTSLILWATRCDTPILIDAAAAAARAADRSVLIVRLSTALQPASPVTFDWISSRSGRCFRRTCLLPALPCAGGLSLVAKYLPDRRLDVTAAGITDTADLPPSWSAERDLAVARAVAVYNAELWAGA
jgi:hypothetical protein